MSELPPDRPRDARGALWFLADRDAFMRRFVLRTLLEPPRGGRLLRPFQPPRH